jgi:multidrug resistance efflux pump
MEILLALIYVAFCIVIFKLFRIPVNEWSLSTAVLGGIVGIFLLILTMNYNHPFTNNARIYFSVTPILPTVKGRVVEVPVHTNAPLKEGDVLFRLDPKPYQYVVDEKKAALAEAEQNVKQLKASFDQASAQTERANSQFQLAQQNYDRQETLFKQNVVAQATLDTATRNLDAAKQTVTAAKAEEERARLAYTSNIDGVNTAVAKLRAELADAEFDLDQTTTRAAGPGFVTQVSLRPGMYAIPTQLRTAMLFVNTGKQDQELGAAFQQNSLQRVAAGDDAEVAFAAVPGRVFKAKVRAVVDAIAAGQLATTPSLIEPETRSTAGRAIAIIDVSEDMHDYKIPLGSTAQVAIYTEYWHHLSLLRKILLRMRSWENYIFSEEHGGGGGGESGGHH